MARRAGGTKEGAEREKEPSKDAAPVGSGLSTSMGGGDNGRVSVSTGDGSPAGVIEHVLAPGDTVSRLALRYGVTVDDIMSANRLFGRPPSALLARRVAIIPASAAPFRPVKAVGP